MGISSEHVVDGVEMKGLLPLDMADSYGFAAPGRRTLGLESSLLGRSHPSRLVPIVRKRKTLPPRASEGCRAEWGRLPRLWQSMGTGRLPDGVLGSWGLWRERVGVVRGDAGGCLGVSFALPCRFAEPGASPQPPRNAKAARQHLLHINFLPSLHHRQGHRNPPYPHVVAQLGPNLTNSAFCARLTAEACPSSRAQLSWTRGGRSV